MVAAGFGICFIPEFSPTIPGVLTRIAAEPEVVREVSLVSISGRRRVVSAPVGLVAPLLAAITGVTDHGRIARGDCARRQTSVGDSGIASESRRGERSGGEEPC